MILALLEMDQGERSSSFTRYFLPLLLPHRFCVSISCISAIRLFQWFTMPTLVGRMGSIFIPHSLFFQARESLPVFLTNFFFLAFQLVLEQFIPNQSSNHSLFHEIFVQYNSRCWDKKIPFSLSI